MARSQDGAQTPSKREIVPWTQAGDGEAGEIVLPANLMASELTLTVERIGDDNYVHLNEWELLAEIRLTPANEPKN